MLWGVLEALLAAKFLFTLTLSSHWYAKKGDEAAVRI